MDLIDDIDAVFSDLRRDSDLVVKAADVFDLIVRSSIELVNVEGPQGIE
jgi:hypothetical protein